MSDEMYEFSYEDLVYETDAAWLLLIDGEEIWLPKSKCELDGDVVLVPEWLAEAKDMI